MATQEDIKKLADIYFLSMNTGVSTVDMEAARMAVGFESQEENPFVFQKAIDLLVENGYDPGNSSTFYGNNVAEDIGASLLYERWQDAPTQEELAEAGLDETVVMNSSAGANAWLTRELATLGVDASTTSGITGKTVEEAAQDKVNTAALVATNPYWDPIIEKAGSFDAAELDIFEWGNLPKKIVPTVTPAAPPTSTTTFQPAVQAPPITAGAGEVVPVQVKPQVVTQQVTPPSYYNQPQIAANTSISNEQAGTFSKPLQTAGLSAVPKEVSYKTHYAGTPGLVDPTLMASTGSNTGGTVQVAYVNPYTGQEIMITELGGNPVTYVPPGFKRKDPKAVPGASEGGYMQGYAAGGSVDRMLESKFIIASRYGYSGPKTNASLNAYAKSSPLISSKFRDIGVMMNKGGLAMAQGGSVPNNTTIAGQPHRLAYVNPQEEAMMKAAGGSGAPSHGGIPAYSLLAQDPNTPVGKVSWDTVNGGGATHVWNGSSWDQGPTIPVAGAATTGIFNPERPDDFDEQIEAWKTSTGWNPSANPGTLASPDNPLVRAETTAKQQQLLSTPGNTSTSTASTWNPAQTTPEQFKNMQKGLVAQTMQPMQSNVQYLDPATSQYMPVDAGQTTPIAPFAEASTVDTVQQANLPTASNAATFDSLAVAPQVAAETAGMTAAQGTVSDQAQTTAQQQLTSGVTGMTAAQGTATMVNAPAAREIQSGEIISGVADAEKAATFNEQIQAATATPSAQATVQGQLEGLMQQFEGGNTPAWAAGSMRTAMATMAARGLGASSMAGQAVIQATMEAALPIAQMDAQVQAQFEGQNLSNRQARAMLAAQQRAQFLGMEFDQAFQSRVANSARIGDVANMNFTAEQNIALENSRAANTMNLNNLSNSQAMVMAEAAALSNLDMANLNNRQQSAVQNAQNFMQMDMVNLSNDQQTTMFKSQQNIQALFTDQAAENASKQFNAASENQTNQFFSNLTGQTAQFNASQQNAMDQFNVNSVNALREFNSNIQNQRDMFNAQNGLVIAQSNAQWRQNLDTLNTTALNDSNREFAATMNGLTAGNLEQIWQRERDIMDYAYKSSASSKDRALSLILADKKYEEYAKARGDAEETSMWSFLTETVLDISKVSKVIGSLE